MAVCCSPLMSCFPGMLHRYCMNDTEMVPVDHIIVAKGRAIPLYIPGQALRVPGGWGSQISRQSAHEGGSVISPTHRSPLPPRKYSWYSFLLEAESIRGPYCGRNGIVTGNTFNFTLHVRCIYIVRYYYYYYYYYCLLLQSFSPRYFSWTNGNPHQSSFKFQTAALPVLSVMFLVQLPFVVNIVNVFLVWLPNFFKPFVTTPVAQIITCK